MALDRFGDIEISPRKNVPEDRETGISEKDTRDPGNQQPEKGGPSVSPDRSGEGFDNTRVMSGKGPSGRKRHFAGMIRWLVICLVIIGFYGATAYFLIPVLMQRVLVPSVADRLSRPIVIDRIVFSPFTFRLFLSGISIGSHDGPGQSGKALLQSESLRCRLGLEQVFEGKLTCNTIVLEGVTIQLQRTGEGLPDLDDLVNILGLQYTDFFENIWPSWISAGEFTLSEGTIILHDTVNSREYQVEKLELYLPSAHFDVHAGARLPELSAVVNGSPVHVEAVRILNTEGKLETSLDLRVRDAYLVHYREYLPLQSSAFSLSDGRADVDLRIIFPAATENRNRFILTGDASLSDVRLESGESRQTAFFPVINFGFSFMPRDKQLQIRNMKITQPEMDVFLRDGGKEHRSGFTPEGVADFAAYAIKSDRRIRIDELEAVSGKIRFFQGKAAEAAFVWDDVTWKVQNFTTPAWPMKEEKGSEQAYFAFNAVDKSDAEPMSLSAEGQVHPGRGSGGRFSVTRLNLHKYGKFLPLFGLRFAAGTGDFRFSYDYAALKAEAKQESGYSFLLSDGYVDIIDFSVQQERGDIKSIEGRKFTCEGLQADPSTRNLTCNSLTVSDSTIDLTATKPTTESLSGPDEMAWQMKVGALQVNDSRLKASFLKEICPASPDLIFDDVGLSADKLIGTDTESSVKVSAKLGSQGRVTLTGRYSPGTRQARLDVVLQDIDFRVFGPCLAPVVIPEVKQGKVHVLGTYALPEHEFTGGVTIKDMTAGSEKGPFISWKNGTAENVFLHLKPLVLDLGSVLIDGPVVRTGIADSEIVLDNFIRPKKHLFDQLTAAEIRIDAGRFTMPWPVILPGYQPELANLVGKLKTLGGKSSAFFLKGKVEGLADFTVNGALDRKSVRSYSLSATDMRFESFAPYLMREFGMPVDTLIGSLQQTLVRSDTGTEIGNRLFLKGADPRTDSPFYPLFALMLDETGELTLENEDHIVRGGEKPFLLPAIKRYFKHQEVRAALNPRLVLNETLPGIEFPVQVGFEPGSSIIPDSGDVAGYAQLLAKRPLLGVSLHPYYDDDSDRTALQETLQKEADRKRDAENRRRVLEKQKRQEAQVKKMAEIKKSQTPIISEEITGEELDLDLEPLPYLQMHVSASMLEELARKRAAAVSDYLVRTLNIAPERIRIEDTVKTGYRQVEISLLPLGSAQK